MNNGDYAKTNCISEVTVESTSNIESSGGMSPYATGGGGITFERKVAVQYLAYLLTGEGAVEFGEAHHAVSVAFQQAPDHPVDDLVICTARPEELKPTWEIALEVRRSPNLVSSDVPSQRLIPKFIRTIVNDSIEDMERRVGLVVSGPLQHAMQLQKLVEIAAAQMDATGFFDLVYTPAKFESGIRARLGHLEILVERGLKDLGVYQPSRSMVRLRTWQLLSRLIVLMPRLESPDETDWAHVQNSLISVARTTDLRGASSLRDRLATLASEYAPKAARVDLTVLRRDAYEVLDSTARHYREAWRKLDSIHEMAIHSTRFDISALDDTRRVALDRGDATKELAATVADAEGVLVSGDSGVGKSALVLSSFADLSTTNSENMQSLCVNIRHLPKLPVEFENILGHPLSTLLSELGAPQRILIVDGADAVTEGKEDVFRFLVGSAVKSQVKVIAIAAKENMQVVRDILEEYFGSRVKKYVVTPLNDDELEEIVKAFPELHNLTSNPRSRDLLRRLVVVDLLVRGDLKGVPLNDADAMREVWSGLVRRHESKEKGLPDARELVLLSLAAWSLSRGDRFEVVSDLDKAAVSGLRHDGLLQESRDNPFMIGPDFSHDEVRRYAIARLLLGDGDPTSRILNAGAPRWALGAARLACQAMLDAPETDTVPLKGRFSKLQESFDKIIEAGYGSRWGDVPSEALLTLSDPGAVLRDAWPKLREEKDAGLKRLARLVDQRLRDANGIVNPVTIEPIIELLLEDATPWKSGKYASNLLREWLSGHVFIGTPVGHSLRILLRKRLVEACEEADQRLSKKLQAEEKALAARTSEDVDGERQLMESHSEFFSEMLYGGRPRRSRRELPHEYRDETFLELLALLGPDLGDDGEAILQRIAKHAPGSLSPVVEEQLTDMALAGYCPELLSQLTEAYYLDEWAYDYELGGYGIRPHNARMSGFMPLHAWYRGPFMTLFRTNFRAGVKTLNRLLNHAALNRANTLARLNGMKHGLQVVEIGPYKSNLEITGTRRSYVGDQHVWMWYRGTGVGPRPCISALLALERTCDQAIKDGISIEVLVSILLDGCENLAMVGLIVGILVRHLETANNQLDPYLIEPRIWTYEFSRVAQESSMFAASSEGIEEPQRRSWSLSEAAMFMVLKADDDRAEDLQSLGKVLVERARRNIEKERMDDLTELDANSGQEIEQQLATVRTWASSLDRTKFEAHETSDGLFVQAVPPKEVVEILQPGNEELERVAEEIRLNARYFNKLNRVNVEFTQANEIAGDLASARELLKNPTSFGANSPFDVPTLIASKAVDVYLLHGVEIPDDELSFAVDTVLRVAEGESPPHLFEFEGSLYEQGADRSAAKVLPLLLMPTAAHVRALADGKDGSATYKRAAAAGLNIARSVANEVRLFLARGLDHLWKTPCAQRGTCHHELGLKIATETMRDCAVGSWITAERKLKTVVLREPVIPALSCIDDKSILASRLDAAIRALGPATVADICISNRARKLLDTLMATQRRSLLFQEPYQADHRGSHSLVNARAILTLAKHGETDPIFTQIDAYAGNSALLGNLLRALSAAAEETPERAATARRIWPSVVQYVLELHFRGDIQFTEDFYDEMALASIIPNATYESAYFYQEIEEEPIEWWDLLSMKCEIEAWLKVAVGKAVCVDQLIGFLKLLSRRDQVELGLPWIGSLALANPSRVVKGSFLLVDWLIETRSVVSDAALSAKWQQVVDALVVEGVTRLAPYSE